MKTLDPTKVYYPVTQEEVWQDFDTGAWYGGCLGSGFAFAIGIIVGVASRLPLLAACGLALVLLSLIPLKAHSRRIGKMIDAHFAAEEKTPQRLA
jgi:hypothetical protein